jgi:hypothetical protein
MGSYKSLQVVTSLYKSLQATSRSALVHVVPLHAAPEADALDPLLHQLVEAAQHILPNVEA